MTLADLVSQCQTPFAVESLHDGHTWHLNSTANFAAALARCRLRYVLTDDLVETCAALAYSKGARTLACADLLRIPARELWVEWEHRPWQLALNRYGFPSLESDGAWAGRRGAFISASADGRRGRLRTFWNMAREAEVLASSMEAYFDLDTAKGEEPECPEDSDRRGGALFDATQGDDDMLARCFRFRYERSWAEYYDSTPLAPVQTEAAWRHALGTIAMDVPLLVTFFLLLSTRTGLPQRVTDLDRVNRARRRRGKPPFLDHIEVRAPLLPEYLPISSQGRGARRSPRLHHVRGHLVRRANQLFWRVPHLRGSARAGAIASRTVVWTFDGHTIGPHGSTGWH
jgi:hypothetical protein